MDELTDPVISEKLYGKMTVLSRWALVLAIGCFLTSMAFCMGLVNEFKKSTEETPVDLPLVTIIGGIAATGTIVAFLLVWFYHQLHRTMRNEMPLLEDWNKAINRLIWFFVLSGLLSVAMGVMFAMALGKELKANMGW